MQPMQAMPRRQHYVFAHKLIPADVHGFAEQTWAALTGPQAGDYVAMQWHKAAEGEASMPMDGIRVFERIQRGPWELLPIAMPEPQGPTEAYFVVLARRPDAPGQVGVFVMEAGVPENGPRAYWAEWRPNGRIRMADLPQISLDAFMAAVADDIGRRSPPFFPPIGQPAAPSHPPPAGWGAPPGHGAPPGYGAPPGWGAPYGAPYHRPPPVPPGKNPIVWIALAVAGIFVLFVLWRVGMMVWYRTVEGPRYAAQQERKDAVMKGVDAFATKLEAKEKQVRGALKTCQEGSEPDVAAAIKKAMPDGRVPRAPKKPKDVAPLQASPPWVTSEDGEPAKRSKGTGHLPPTPWVATPVDACTPWQKAALDDLEALEKAKPARYDDAFETRGPEWVKTGEAALAAFDQKHAMPKPAPPATVAVHEYGCTTRAITQYSEIAGGLQLSLDASQCWVAVAWVSVAEGKVLGSARADGSASPEHPGTIVSEDRLREVNAAARTAAQDKATEALKKTLTAWGGGMP